MKVRVKNTNVMFHCPACHHAHVVPFEGPGKWNFNGDLENPTITPSLKIFIPAVDGLPERILCHLNVTEGQLQFHSDSGHELKGKTIPMVEWNADHESKMVF